MSPAFENCGNEILRVKGQVCYFIRSDRNPDFLEGSIQIKLHSADTDPVNLKPDPKLFLWSFAILKKKSITSFLLASTEQFCFGTIEI